MNPDIKENTLKVQKQRNEMHRNNNIQSNESKDNQQIIEAYDYLANAASAQDCTGLIPAKPQSKEEVEAYEELYHFLPPGGQFH